MFKLWRLVALVSFATKGLADDLEVEVEEEVDDDEEPVRNGGSFTSANFKIPSNGAKGGWDFDALTEAGVVHVTNELFDTKIYNSDEPWLLVFSKGQFETNPYHGFESINKKLSENLLEMLKGKSINIGHVDIHSEGECLKETFDLTEVPSIRMLKDDKVYHLKWEDTGLWSTNTLNKFVTEYESSLYDYARPRVSEGIMLSVEYVLNTLADKNFN